MSLINEALKKAQRQRTLASAPLSRAPSGVAAAAVTTHVPAASQRRFLAPLWFGLGLLAIGAGTTALIMRYGIAPATPPPVAAVKPLVKPPTASPAAVVNPPAPEALPPIILPGIRGSKVDVDSTSALAPNEPRASSRPPPPAESAFSLPPPVSIPVPLETQTADQAPRIRLFLDAARINGVRGRDAEARVLINEKVFRLNDTIEADLGLRLSAVRPGMLVFTDAQGRSYSKNY